MTYLFPVLMEMTAGSVLRGLILVKQSHGHYSWPNGAIVFILTVTTQKRSPTNANQ